MELVCVVILNYLNYTDTIECVESVRKDNYKNKRIIIVDNCSYNESFDVLVEKYKNDEEIFVLKTEDNLGFAKGNNIGIKFAREKWNCDFILLLNNDTVCNNRNLITELINAYELNIAIIGPRIISANKREQNPVIENFSKMNLEKVLFEKNSYKDKIRKYLIKIKPLVQIKRFLFNKYVSYDEIGKNKIASNVCSTDLILHGSCMLLTKDYFKYYPYLYPNTFLYYEENILTLITKKVGLNKKFINTTDIFHKEDQSSELSFNNDRNIINKYIKESMLLCYNLFDMDYDEILEKHFTD